MERSGRPETGGSPAALAAVPRRALSPPRIVLFAAALALSVYLVVANRDDFVQALRLLREADPGWIALAGLIELAMLAGIIGGYVALFGLVGRRYPIGRLTVVWLATNLLNQAIPSAGVVAAGFFVAYSPRAIPAGITLFAIAAHGYLDYLAFAGLSAVTLGLKAGREGIPWPILVAAVLSVLISLTSTLLAVLLLREREPVEQAIRRVATRASEMLAALHPRLAFDPQRVAVQVVHAVDGLAGALRRGPGLIVPLLLAVFVQAARPLQLFVISRAIGSPIDLLTAASGYVSAGLATYWTFLPGGIGVYGGTLAEILSRSIPSAAATAISIAQRTLNFWAPMLAGALSLLALQIRRDEGAGTGDRKAGAGARP